MSPGVASLLFVAACFVGLMVYAFACDRAASVGRNAERQDPQGLGPKDEHAVGEAETPESRSND
jgi:hypothetical protein